MIMWDKIREKKAIKI